MKRLIIIILSLSSGVLYSQTTSSDKDTEARIKLFCNMHPEIFDLKIHSAEAESMFHIVTYSFTEFMIIPDISFENISNTEERTIMFQYIETLKNILQNPPTWDYLLSEQQQIVEQGPNPPVFVGDTKAEEFYSVKKKHQNRHAAGDLYIIYEDETDIPEESNDDIEKKK